MSQYLLPRELGGYWAEGEPLGDGTVRLRLSLGLSASSHSTSLIEPIDGDIVLPASWLTELPEPPPADAFVLASRTDGGEVVDLLILDDELPTLLRSVIYRDAPRRGWPEVVKAYPCRRVLVALAAWRPST